MALLSTLIDHHGGGLLHKHDLVRLGAADRHLTAAVRNRDVRRARRGWYTTFSPDDPRFVAVRVGGRLTGASALKLLGAWTWGVPPVTVSVPGNAARLRRRPGVTVVYDRPEVVARGSSWSVDPVDALREALLQAPFEEAVALLDWSLHEHLLTVDEVWALTATLPRDAIGLASWIDEKCESFLESIVRTRLLALGYAVESQHVLKNGQRIDLVVDGVIGLEVDGREFHRDSFESDRRKDLRIMREGKTAMRLSYSMVLECWDDIVAALDAALVAHRRAGELSGLENSGPTALRPPRGPRRWRLVRRARAAWPEKSRRAPVRLLHRPGRHGPLGSILG